MAPPRLVVHVYDDGVNEGVPEGVPAWEQRIVPFFKKSYLGKNIHNIKFTILTIFNCPVQGH